MFLSRSSGPVQALLLSSSIAAAALFSMFTSEHQCRGAEHADPALIPLVISTNAPDLSELDEDSLRLLCTNLHVKLAEQANRIEKLERELQRLKVAHKPQPIQNKKRQQRPGQAQQPALQQQQRHLAGPPNRAIERVLKSIPADIRPHKGDKWNEIYLKRANKWITKELVGRQVKVKVICNQDEPSFLKVVDPKLRRRYLRFVGRDPLDPRERLLPGQFAGKYVEIDSIVAQFGFYGGFKHRTPNKYRPRQEVWLITGIEAKTHFYTPIIRARFDQDNNDVLRLHNRKTIGPIPVDTSIDGADLTGEILRAGLALRDNVDVGERLYFHIWLDDCALSHPFTLTSKGKKKKTKVINMR